MEIKKLIPVCEKHEFIYEGESNSGILRFKKEQPFVTYQIMILLHVVRVMIHLYVLDKTQGEESTLLCCHIDNIEEGDILLNIVLKDTQEIVLPA